MKKINIVLLSSCLLVILSACQIGKKNVETEEEEKVIDQEVLQKIVGTWHDSSYDFAEYVISVDNTSVYFDRRELVVNSAEENEISTHEKDNEKSSVFFRIEDEQVTVLHSHEVPKGMVGGDLAPITLSKKRKITTNYINGVWQSAERDYTDFIRVQSNFNPKEFNFYVYKRNEFQEGDFEVLTVVSEADEDIKMINEDKSMYYTFSFYEEDKLIIVPSTTDTENEGTGRPWILSRDY